MKPVRAMTTLKELIQAAEEDALMYAEGELDVMSVEEAADVMYGVANVLRRVECLMDNQDSSQQVVLANIYQWRAMLRKPNPPIEEIVAQMDDTYLTYYGGRGEGDRGD